MSYGIMHDELCQLVAILTRAISTASILPPNHVQVISCIQEAYVHLKRMFEANKEITFVLFNDRLVCDDVTLMFRGTYGNTFINMLRQRSIERITFLSGLSLVDLTTFFANMVPRNQTAIRSTDFIKIGKIKIRDLDKEGTILSAYEEEEYVPVVDITDSPMSGAASNSIRMGIDAFEKIKTKGTLDFDIINEIISTFLSNIYDMGTPLSMLASLKTADEYTYTHAINVGILTMCQAESIGFNGCNLKNIGTAAVLHDIGKIFIPDGILLKTGPLTSEERSIVEEHTVKGARHLIKMKNLPRLTVLTALEHHIRYDGSGYPGIEGGWETNIVSQMISIADVFDALRTQRPYREPLSLERIEKTMLNDSGTYFNPLLLRRFLKIIKR